jgi:hypothetical protein
MVNYISIKKYLFVFRRESEKLSLFLSLWNCEQRYFLGEHIQLQEAMQIYEYTKQIPIESADELLFLKPQADMILGIALVKV